MKLAIMDGQGGGIGATVIKGLRKVIGPELELWAVGTNSVATTRMMKSGANKGATGENAFLRSSQKVDMIIGPISIMMANAMMGEMTPAMASAVSSSEAIKVLIPLSQEKIRLVGISSEPLPHLVDQVVEIVKEMVEKSLPRVGEESS